MEWLLFINVKNTIINILLTNKNFEIMKPKRYDLKNDTTNNIEEMVLQFLNNNLAVKDNLYLVINEYGKDYMFLKDFMKNVISRVYDKIDYKSFKILVQLLTNNNSISKILDENAN